MYKILQSLATINLLSIKNNEIKLRTENAIVAQRFYELIDFLYNIKINVVSTDAGVYYATLEGPEVIKILRDMKLTGVPMRIEREIVRKLLNAPAGE